MKFQRGHYREFIKELFSSLTGQYLHIKRNYTLCPLCTREPRTHAATGCNIDVHVSACALYFYVQPFPSLSVTRSLSATLAALPGEKAFKALLPTEGETLLRV